jgi:hypothetical protein
MHYRGRPKWGWQDDVCTRVPPDHCGYYSVRNVDLIAQGLSPFDPALAMMTAGRLMLREIGQRVAAMVDFPLESTLSGGGYARRVRRCTLMASNLTGNTLLALTFINCATFSLQATDNMEVLRISGRTVTLST